MSMKHSPKLRPGPWDLLVAAAVLALAVACGTAVWGRSPGDSLTAVVSIEGAEADRLSLASSAQRVYSNNGYTLEVEFCPGGETGVRVRSSDCPSQDCVHTGTITRSGQSIVCLPARISIQLVGDGPSSTDAVIG
ncbi:NusG domain II-containing protein [Oscillibacter sp. MSJ-2]|uniref:NusG domain II-containing protein n=1 Tax=Dysosmobacter acutus TaxID=2841504 RepID=A0ABS6F7H9_9FIRM|nr:NusG domain II-containing protein [Dysosmobacter acutus]MBU5626023.1 NusG domain II-containing protein [Dysosmobacter acutus]